MVLETEPLYDIFDKILLKERRHSEQNWQSVQKKQENMSSGLTQVRLYLYLVKYKCISGCYVPAQQLSHVKEHGGSLQMFANNTISSY